LIIATVSVNSNLVKFTSVPLAWRFGKTSTLLLVCMDSCCHALMPSSPQNNDRFSRIAVFALCTGNSRQASDYHIYIFFSVLLL